MLTRGASRRKQKTRSLSVDTTSLHSRGFDTGTFPSIYDGVFGDYSSIVVQTDTPTNIVSAVEQAFDSDDHSTDPATTNNTRTASTNPHLGFPATVSNWNSSLLSTSQSQSSTTRNQASPTPPSFSLEDFAGENSLHDCNYGELLDDHLNSLLSDDSEKSTRIAQLRTSPSDSLSDALNASSSPSDSYKTSTLFPWIQTWPTQDLGDKAWSDVVSKKALSRPEWTTVQHLLRLYFQYLNPLLPVLKERDLYSLIHPETQNDGGTSTKAISLALFNAIMFAASSVSS